MTKKNKPQVGAVLDFRLRVYHYVVVDGEQVRQVRDLSDATAVKYRFKPPGDAASFEKTAAVESPATAGYVKYTTAAADLSSAGAWKVQAFVTVTGGAEIPSEVLGFEVEFNIADPA